MGQYFTLVNPDKEEVVHLPGMLKAGERITNPVAMGILGYLVLEGPNDGTNLSRTAETDTELVREKVEELRERERESEERNFERYMEERPSYIVNQFEGEPDEDPEAFEEYCREKSLSRSYRNDDGSWDEDALIRIALSYLEINETHDAAGRWGGCRVALTGDYSNGEWYDKTQTHTVCKLLETGEEVRLQGIREAKDRDGSRLYSHPISTDDIPYADEPGDYLEVRAIHHDGDDDEIAEVIRIEDPEYTDITDMVVDEFTEYVGEQWVENAEDVNLHEPDLVIQG